MSIVSSNAFRVTVSDAGTLSIPAKTFVARSMLGIEIGRSPWMWGYGRGTSKHQVGTSDTVRRKIIISAADHRGLFWVNYGVISAN